MNSLMKKIRSFLENCTVNDVCDECLKHNRQFDVDCDGCSAVQKKRMSSAMMYLTYH